MYMEADLKPRRVKTPINKDIFNEKGIPLIARIDINSFFPAALKSRSQKWTTDRVKQLYTFKFLSNSGRKIEIFRINEFMFFRSLN